MSTRSRALLVAIVLGAATLPVATAHTLAPVLIPHHGAPEELEFHLEVVPLFALTVLSFIPLLGLLRGLVRWLGAERQLRQLTRNGVRASRRGIAYVRIPGDQVALFTSGFRRPEIYATQGAERGLRAAAFEAALLHEQAHIRHRDLRWLPLVALAEAALGIFPSARSSFRDLRVEAEWAADRAALAAGVPRLELFDAIVGAADGAPGAAALSGVGTVERLRWLADPTSVPLAERGLGGAMAGLLAPPITAHALVWTGLLCAICAHHFG